MILSILLTSVGIAFASRILGSSLQKIGLMNLHARIFLTFAALMICFFLFLGAQPVSLWLFFGMVFILLKLLPNTFSIYQEKLLRRHTLRIVDHLILNVQSGQTLRASLSTIARQESSLLRVSLENILHALAYETSASGLKSLTLRQLFEDLRRIEKSQSKCAEQLRSLRRNLKILEDFRRRSRQVTLQIRMQAAVSALLYGGLLLFMITQFGFSPHRGLILVSGTLFFIGTVTVFVIGRRIQWTT